MDMAVNAIAIVLVPDIRLLDMWLGSKPVVKHTLDKLRDVRGIDYTCILAPPATKMKKYPWINGNAFWILPSAELARDDYAAVRWLLHESSVGEALKTRYILVLRAEQPFTPQSHIEQTFGCVQFKDADPECVHLVVRPVSVMDPHNSEVVRAEATRGVWACQRAFLEPERPHWCRKIATIPVGSVESLSLLDPHGEAACRALMDAGFH